MSEKDVNRSLRGVFAEYANTAAFNIIAVLPLMIVIAASLMPALFLLGITLDFDAGRFVMISYSVLLICAAAAGKHVLGWALSVSRSDRASAGAAATVCAAAVALFAAYESNFARILICFAVNAAIMISAYLVLHRKDKSALMLTLSVLLLTAFMLTAFVRDNAGMISVACAGVLLPFAVPASICAWFGGAADIDEDDVSDVPRECDKAEAEQDEVSAQAYLEYDAEICRDNAEVGGVEESETAMSDSAVSNDDSADVAVGEAGSGAGNVDNGSESDGYDAEHDEPVQSSQQNIHRDERVLAAALLREANSLYKSGRHAEALDKYRASCAVNRTDKLERFIENLENILKAQEIVRRANEFYRDKKYDEALALYRESLSFYKSSDVERFIASLQKKLLLN